MRRERREKKIRVGFGNNKQMKKIKPIRDFGDILKRNEKKIKLNQIFKGDFF